MHAACLFAIYQIGFFTKPPKLEKDPIDAFDTGGESSSIRYLLNYINKSKLCSVESHTGKSEEDLLVCIFLMIGLQMI